MDTLSTGPAWRQAEAAQMTEAELLSHVTRMATDLRWLWYHAPDNRPGGRSGRVQRVVPGFPDLTLTRAGRLMFVELKTQKGRVTPEQEQWLVALGQTGYPAMVWRPMDLMSGVVARCLGAGV